MCLMSVYHMIQTLKREIYSLVTGSHKPEKQPIGVEDGERKLEDYIQTFSETDMVVQMVHLLYAADGLQKI